MSRSIPHYSRPPWIPLATGYEPKQMFAEPRAVRLAGLEANRVAASFAGIPIEDGATSIPDPEVFETLSHRDDVPGALGVREVKYLVTGVDTDTPQIFFLNTKKHKYHYSFARGVLDVKLTNGEFNRVTYFTDERRFLAGTLLAHDSFERPDGSTGLFALEFWPTDPVKVSFAAIAFELASNAMRFAGDRLAYHPSGVLQEELFESEREEFQRRRVRTVSTGQIFAKIRYSPLNLGVGFGKIRVIDGSNPQPASITNVVVFKTLPNDLSHVAGVISEEPQTPLSHVNLRAKQNNTPNAYLRQAGSDPRIVTHLNSIVRFEVAVDDVSIRAATAPEMEDFLEEQRPREPQFPPRDLSREAIVDLEDAGHDDLTFIGAKAANLAELRRVLGPEIVPTGYAVPFYFYDRFMSKNGLYEKIRRIINDDEFAGSEEVREERLAEIRKRIMRARVPKKLRKALAKMRERFPKTTSLRCRSSTNNEDLSDFNGAGLYDSFTHRPDEGHIEKSIKQVWASLWTRRAFEERHFYRIDHFHTAMAVLVHPNFDDELANGVALTKNIYFPDFKGYYVNVQVGESLVTNPDPNAIPEELLIMEDVSERTPGETSYEIIRIRRSSLVDSSDSVLSEDQIKLLTRQMELIQEHFSRVYNAEGSPTFAMDLEFKIDKRNRLAIKQARPWVD